MPPVNARLQQLFELWFNDQANEAEKQELTELVRQASSGRDLPLLLQQAWEGVQDEGSFDEDKQEALISNILSRYPANGDVIAAEETAIVRSIAHRRHRWWWAAAAVLLVLAAGAYIWTSRPGKPDAFVQTTTAQDIPPGKDGAVLTLSDGREIVLDSLGNGIVAMENGAQVRLKSGQLEYEQIQTQHKEIEYNRMTTPRGRQFRVTLPDGTEVWLNAASSIRFPVEFSATERRVEVTGEAFFHVKSMNLPAFNGRPAMKVPFVVNVNKQLDIEVLGTQFNVNAYTNEKAIHTTLEEGIVRVRTTATQDEASQTAILRAGLQASVNNAGSRQITVQDADIAKVLAWRNGLFNFDNVSLADAMLQLERWYDIDVSYEKNIPNIWFSGKMSRDINLPGLLKILEKTGVQFRIEGRKLVVLQEH